MILFFDWKINIWLFVLFFFQIFKILYQNVSQFFVNCKIFQCIVLSWFFFFSIFYFSQISISKIQFIYRKRIEIMYDLNIRAQEKIQRLMKKNHLICRQCFEKQKKTNQYSLKKWKKNSSMKLFSRKNVCIERSFQNYL